MTYTSAGEVVAFTGVTPADLDVDDDEALAELLAEWAGHVKDLIDVDRRRDFLAEADGDPAKVPGTVRSVSLRAMRNYVRLAMLSRESAIVRLDEWRIGVDDTDRVLTRDLERELARIPRGGSPVRGFVSRGR